MVVSCALLLGVLVMSMPARADIEMPAAIPSGLSPQIDNRLTETYEALLAQRDALRTDMDRHNAECSQVPDTDEEKIGFCQQSRAALAQRIDDYREALRSYEKARAEAVDAERRRVAARIEQTRARIKTDQEQFRRLGLGATTDAFETWGELADDQRREFEKSTILSAISVGANILEVGSRPIGSFTPPQANALISWLRSKGVTDPFLEEGIRKVAMTSGKPEMRKNVQAVAEMIDKGVGTSGIFHGLANLQLEALSGVLATFLKTPDAKGAQALGESLVNFYFAEKAMGVIEPDLDKLVDLPQQQLASVNRLSLALRKHVGELNTLKRELAQLH